jgi:ankyrin repeat protein
MRFAIINNNVVMTKLFLDYGLPLYNKHMNSPLHKACKYNNTEIVRLLLTRGVDVNEVNDDGETPIFLTDSKKIISLLVNHGAKIHIQNKKGNTPLHDAIKCESLKATRILLSLGADPLITNHRGQTVRALVRYLNNKREWNDSSDSDNLAEQFETLIAPYEFDCIKGAVDDTMIDI